MKKGIKFYVLFIISILIIILVTDYQISLLNINDVSKTNIIKIAFALVTGIVLIVSLYIYNKEDFNEIKAFKIIVPIIFILFFLSLPVLKNHDEDVHWHRIYDISLGNIITKTEKGDVFVEGSNNLPAGVFPCAVQGLIDIQHSKEHKIEDLLNLEITQEELIIEMTRVAVYAPIQYMPQAIGVYITRIFTNKPYIMATVTRLLNMIFTFTILYFAIKLMPFGKKILLVLMTIPIAVEVLTSLSPDGMTISMCFLFIAYILNLLVNKDKIETKDVLILVVLSVIVSLCKIVYLPLVGLVLILPKTKFKSRKNQILKISLIIGIATLVNLIWLSISSKYLIDYENGRALGQLTMLLEHPVRYVQMLLHTISLNINEYTLSMFGIQLGINEYIKIYAVVPYIFFLICLLVGITDSSIKNRFSKYQVIIIFLIIFAVCALIFTSLYIQWTKTDNTSIMGIQGRYFLPIMPLVILLFGLLKFETKYKEENILKGISIAILMTQINVIMTIVSNSI